MTLLQNHRQLLNGSKLVLLILLILISHLLAQEKNQFQKGIQFFNSGDYVKAIEYLEKFSDQKSEFAETANLILILSYYRLNDLEKTKNFISRFESNFSNSSSLYIVLETKLAIAIIQKDFEGIKNSLIKLNKLSVKKEQVKDFVSAFNKMFTFLNDQSINELEPLISNSILKFSFARARFQNEIEKRNSTLIKKYYTELIKIGFREELLKVNKIGVLIPKEIKSGSIENLIIEGLKFGVHRFNKLNDGEIELKIYKGDQKTLENALVQLAKDPEVLCVIGPLYSNQFKALSSLAEKLCIPLISPTATASDISIKSRYIFQFNPTLDVRGYAMASYAIDKLKLTRFALLNSDNPTLKSISNEIKKKIKNSKCELIADLSWNENKKTLSSKIKELRKAAASRDLVIRFTPLLDFETEQKLISFGMKQDLIDSLKMIEAEVSIFEIFGKDAERICKSNKIDFYKRTKSIAGDLNVPLYSIDAIFIPISDDKLIPAIINEIENQNIIALRIGNDNWNSLEELNKAYPASNGVIFTSDFYFDMEDNSFKDLSEEIFEYTKIQPNRTFFYGFESVTKILSNWNDNLHRENFYEKMIDDRDYEGVSSDIILNRDGVNSSVYIFEYRGKKIKKIDRIISN